MKLQKKSQEVVGPQPLYNPYNARVVTPNPKLPLFFGKHLLGGYHHPISNDRPNCPPCSN